MNAPKKVLFLSPYPFQRVPSQRFRFEQYLPLLATHSISFKMISFYGNEYKKRLYEKPGLISYTSLFLQGSIRAFRCILLLPFYQYVFLHREFIPFGPPIMEWIISKVFKKKIIYDFDDAIWLNDPTESHSIKTRLKWKSKVRQIIKWSYKVSCGNQYLCEFSKKYNKNCFVLPTTIDTIKLHNPDLFHKPINETVVIGWTGSHSTNHYLRAIELTLQKLEKNFNVSFLFITDKDPGLNLKNQSFKKWNKDREVEDLLLLDIGIMPLTKDEWSLGKCGFKLLQYMALEIPAVASPVGENNLIIEHGTNGFLASSNEEWYDLLKKLIENKNLRTQLGKSGRKKIIESYSVISNSSTFLALFA